MQTQCVSLYVANIRIIAAKSFFDSKIFYKLHTIPRHIQADIGNHVVLLLVLHDQLKQIHNVNAW